MGFGFIRRCVFRLDSAGTNIIIDSYDEYGVPGLGNQGRFQYTGQIWLPELGMYYYKARVYSPTFGRFMQTDPIGYAGGGNLYNYVRSNPVNATDPSGLVDFPAPPPPPPSFVDEVVVNGVRPPQPTFFTGFSIVNSQAGMGGESTYGYDERAAREIVVTAPRPQKTASKPNSCNSTLYRVGNGMKYAGKGIAYSGIGIAAIGAPAGPVGAAPGLTIAEGGGALGAIGQGLQDIAFSRPGLEIATRFAANLFGGKVLSSLGLVPSSLRSGLGDAIYEEATTTALSPAFPSLDPARCPG